MRNLSAILLLIASGCGVSPEMLRKEIDRAQAENNQAISVNKTETVNAVAEIRKKAEAAVLEATARVDTIAARIDEASARLAALDGRVASLTEEVQNRILDIDRSVASRTEGIETKVTARLATEKDRVDQEIAAMRAEFDAMRTGIEEARGRLAENTRDILAVRASQEKVDIAMVQYSEAVNEMRKRVDGVIDRYRQNLLIEKRLLLERQTAVEQALKEVDAQGAKPAGGTPQPPPAPQPTPPAPQSPSQPPSPPGG